jgi:vitamin B12 transporter
MEKRLLFLLILLVSTATFAQSDSSRTLKQVTVRAVLPVKIQTQTPAQQVSAADFKRLAAYNVADAIRNFSGVNIKDYGGIGGLKTVSVRSLGANHTGVQFDGVQVTDGQNGQIDLGKINLENVSSITLYNGHSAELLQPARAYASASMLVIKSLAPHFEGKKNERISLGYRTGSFGLINPTLLWQQKLSPRWSLNFSSNWQKAHGRYKYKVEGDGSDTLAVRRNGQLSTFQSDAALYWKGTDSNRFQFRINYANSSRGLPGAVVFYNPYSNQHLWNKDLFVQSSYQQHFSNGLQLLLNGKFSRNHLRYLDPDYLNQAGELDQRFRQIEVYGSAALSYPISTAWEVSVASDLAFNKLNTNLYNYAYPSRFTFLNAVSTKFSLNKLTAQATLLNTNITEQVEMGSASPAKNIWSPAFSISYKPFDENDLQFRAFYKDIFRNPTFNDLYYTRSGKRDLKPEYAKQYNAGVTYSKTYNSTIRYLSLTADVYYNKVKDKIIAIPNKDLFTWTMMNLGLVDIRGLDFGMKTQFALGQKLDFSLSGNYTYQEAIDITDPESSVYLEQIPYTPKHTLAVNAGISNGQTGIFYNHILSSSRYYLSENLPQYYVPGFSVSDLSVSHQLKTKYPISISAEINNLFNQSYAFIRSFPMPGRSLRLSFQITI